MKEKVGNPLHGKQLVDIIIAAAQEKLAERLTIIDLHEISVTADYFIITESGTTIQNTAIANAIVDRCEGRNTRPWHIEGEREGRWILIDFSDVVVHIMLPALRTHYSLETLWTSGKRTNFSPTGS